MSKHSLIYHLFWSCFSMQQHEALEKYQSVWSSYKCVYESSNEAQNLLQAEEKFRGYLAQGVCVYMRLTQQYCVVCVCVCVYSCR